MSDNSNNAMKIQPSFTDLPPDEAMDDRVRRLKTPKDCLIFMKNAADRGRPDLAQQARRQAIRLRAHENEPKTPLERAWFEALHAYEDVLAHRNGGPIRASNIRPLLKKHGAREAIERALAADGESSTYELLKAVGLQDLSFESMVMRFPQEFSAGVTDRAKASLASWA